MKAAILKEIGRPFAIEEVPRPTIDRDEVVIETHTCGICRTDVHIQDGLAYTAPLPHIPGHEPAGVVAEVGRDVKTVRVGDRVVPHLFVTDPGHSCDDDRHAPHADLKGIIGVTTPGGFAEYFKAPARNLLAVPDNVSFEDAGLVSCALITAVHAWHRARVKAGESVIVIGAGGIGLVEIQLLTSAGANVIATDIDGASRELAKESGAELAVHPDELVKRVRAWTDGHGVDCAFDFVGRAETGGLAAKCLRQRGRLVVIGEEAESPDIDTITIAQHELEIIGSRNGGMADAAEALDLLAAGRIKPHVDRRFPLDQFNEAMDYVRSGRARGRVVIHVAS